jgi:hypothetical protein
MIRQFGLGILVPAAALLLVIPVALAVAPLAWLM